MIAGKLKGTKLQIKLLKIKLNSLPEWLHLENTFIPKDFSMVFTVMQVSKHAKEDQVV
jgi:hypothetical protein